jgi:hypothetical protein
MSIPRSLVVSLIGSALIVISVFLPWVLTIYSIPDIGTHTVSTSGIEDNLGQLILLIGVASIGILFVNQKGFRVKFGLLLAVINLFVIIYFGLKISFGFPYPVDMFQQSIQFGLYVAIIGTLTLIVGKVVEHMTKIEKEIKPQESSYV